MRSGEVDSYYDDVKSTSVELFAERIKKALDIHQRMERLLVAHNLFDINEYNYRLKSGNILIPASGLDGSAVLGFLDFLKNNGVNSWEDRIWCVDRAAGLSQRYAEVGVVGVRIVEGVTISDFISTNQVLFSMIFGRLQPGEVVTELMRAQIDGSPYFKDALGLFHTEFSPTDAHIPELNDELKIDNWFQSISTARESDLRLFSYCLQRTWLIQQEIHVFGTLNQGNPRVKSNYDYY